MCHFVPQLLYPRQRERVGETRLLVRKSSSKRRLELDPTKLRYVNEVSGLVRQNTRGNWGFEIHTLLVSLDRKEIHVQHNNSFLQTPAQNEISPSNYETRSGYR